MIAPGAAATDFGGGAVRDKRQVAAMVAGMVALGRVAEADDIGNAAAAILSDHMASVNGMRADVGQRLSSRRNRKRGTGMTEKNVALTDGAGPGLGAAIAERFAAAGLRVAVAGRRWKGVAAIAETSGAEIEPYECDATREDEADGLLRRAAWTQELDLRSSLERC